MHPWIVPCWKRCWCRLSILHLKTLEDLWEIFGLINMNLLIMVVKGAKGGLAATSKM